MKIFLIRILVCVVLCSLLGLERQYHYKILGFRTNILVALGSFLFVYYTFGNVQGDEMRMAAAVVSGVGFLCAGVIMQHGNKVIGLDTAATLWCVAAVGVLCACGLLREASIGTFLILVSNFFVRSWTHTAKQKYIVKYYKCIVKVSCDSKLENKTRKKILDRIEKVSVRMESFEKSFSNSGVVHLAFTFISNNTKSLDDLVKDLSDDDGVNKISWSYEKIDNVLIEEEAT